VKSCWANGVLPDGPPLWPGGCGRRLEVDPVSRLHTRRRECLRGVTGRFNRGTVGFERLLRCSL
jgi:hypothetical protein